MRWLALVPWLDKKILLALTLTVAAAGTGYAVFTSGASAPAPPGVTSRVLDMVTGDPLGGVSVQVTDEDGVDEGEVFWEDLKVFTHGRNDETSKENR